MKEKCDDEQKAFPWIDGILDTLVGADLLAKSNIPHRNRLAVILLDSAFETACRTFLKYSSKIKLEEAHRHREPLVKTVRSKLSELDNSVWETIDFYYNDIRCDFYHVSAGKTITDESLFEYRETVYFVIHKAFGSNIERLVANRLSALQPTTPPVPTEVSTRPLPNIHTASTKKDRVLIAVAAIAPKGYDDVNEYFRKQGVSMRLESSEFTNMVARRPDSKILFYYDKTARCWQISGLGEFRLGQLQKGEE